MPYYCLNKLMRNYLKKGVGCSMDIKQIIDRRRELERKLQIALATMEKSNAVKMIYQEIKENQNNCPHDINYSLNKNGICPYCGKFRED